MVELPLGFRADSALRIYRYRQEWGKNTWHLKTSSSSFDGTSVTFLRSSRGTFSASLCTPGQPSFDSSFCSHCKERRHKGDSKNQRISTINDFSTRRSRRTTDARSCTSSRRASAEGCRVLKREENAVIGELQMVSLRMPRKCRCPF